MRRPISMVLCALMTIFGGVSVMAAALTDCPDCAAPVSSRALMCPGCGCPGDAIAEHVTELAAVAPTNTPPAPLFPVVCVKSASVKGYGVAVRSGGGDHIVFDTKLLGDASSLTLTALDGDPVPYAQPELSGCQRLIRFASTSTNVVFVPSAAQAKSQSCSLDQDGRVVPHDSRSETAVPVALCDSSTNVFAVHLADGQRSVLLSEVKWRRVTPRELRSILNKEKGRSE